jgi:lipopolysaccharide transport system ATP-binding protein
MSSEISIAVRGVSKSYELASSPRQRLMRLLMPFAVQPRLFQALHEIDIEIARGEFFGVVGQNGSGKSTLLQIISGIVRATSGTVEVKGRIASTLELGAGFNPEFTGRENAGLNAQILGINPTEFARILPEIERFADIGEFIDQPVKTYSSGMFVRLAFAVQACIEPDILIIDEALAVGDIFFRLKCYERLARLRERGCTVILVTHSMEDVMHYCDRVLLLHHGRPLFCGDAAQAINRYYALGQLGRISSGAGSAGVDDMPLQVGEGADSVDWPEQGFVHVADREQFSAQGVRCIRVAVLDEQGQPRQVFRQFERARIHAEFEVSEPLQTPAAGFVLRTDKGVVVHGLHTGQSDTSVPAAVPGQSLVRAWHDVQLGIGPGEYVVDVTLASWPRDIYEVRTRIPMAELEATAGRHCILTAAVPISVIPKGDVGFDAQPFYGLAGIQSRSHLAAVQAMPTGTDPSHG